jgi:hypothetical protein
MTRVTQISNEELEPVVTARTKAAEAAQNAEKALKDAKLAELEFKVQIQQLYLAKGLDTNCKVDISNGSIAWPDEIQNTPTILAEEVQPEPKITSKKRVKTPAPKVDE